MKEFLTKITIESKCLDVDTEQKELEDYYQMRWERINDKGKRLLQLNSIESRTYLQGLWTQQFYTEKLRGLSDERVSN